MIELVLNETTISPFRFRNSVRRAVASKPLPEKPNPVEEALQNDLKTKIKTFFVKKEGLERPEKKNRIRKAREPESLNDYTYLHLRW